MDPLKKILLEVDEENQQEIQNKVVVIGYSISECLKKAAEFFQKDLGMLDYEILEKGKKSLFKKKPFKILVKVNSEFNPFADLEEFSFKIGAGDKLLDTDLDKYIKPKDVDGYFSLKIYSEGVFLTVCPPKGNGKHVEVEDCIHRLQQRGVLEINEKLVERVVREERCEPVKIAEYRNPKPEYDSTFKIEITPDDMKAFVKITPPRKGGKDLKVEDIVNGLKLKGIVIGFKEENMKDALDQEKYMEDILAAEGIPPKHGRDAYIEYKVNIQKDVKLEEDETGKVDYRKLNLIENVVPGQVLAEKIPAEKGISGRTLFNKIILARDGKDIELKPGKNTVLSDEGRILKAEIDGQVVLIGSRLNVENVYRVLGDVGPKTGNIEFLGSVIVAGSVLDNHQIKAGGNVEIYNSVQMSLVEAEGNIVVKGGILAKDAGKVHSSGGSIFAKFIQNAKIFAMVDVIVEEVIMHSFVEAGERVICEGRRAKIVGGTIRAKKEVKAREIGSSAQPKTEILVGYDPILLSRFEELDKILSEKKKELDKLKRTKHTLEIRKKEDPDSFLAEQRKKLEETTQQVEEMEKEVQEINAERMEVQKEMEEIAQEGKVIVEKQVFPGVIIKIKDAVYNVIDNRFSVQYVYKDGKIVEEKYTKKIKKK